MRTSTQAEDAVQGLGGPWIPKGTGYWESPLVRWTSVETASRWMPCRSSSHRDAATKVALPALAPRCGRHPQAEVEVAIHASMAPCESHAKA